MSICNSECKMRIGFPNSERASLGRVLETVKHLEKFFESAIKKRI